MDCAALSLYSSGCQFLSFPAVVWWATPPQQHTARSALSSHCALHAPLQGPALEHGRQEGQQDLQKTEPSVKTVFKLLRKVTCKDALQRPSSANSFH